MTIYVGNIPSKMEEKELRLAFEKYGEVRTISIIMDKVTGESRGFGFVDMPHTGQGQNAIIGISGANYYDQIIVVKEARPRT